MQEGLGAGVSRVGRNLVYGTARISRLRDVHVALQAFRALTFRRLLLREESVDQSGRTDRCNMSK